MFQIISEKFIILDKMKISTLIICLFIFGYILNLDEFKSYIWDINYSSEYTVDLKAFPEGYIPELTELYFRSKLTPTKNMSVKKKLHKFQAEAVYPSFVNIYTY